VSARPLPLLLVAAIAGTLLTACSNPTGSLPECEAGPRLATIAQSVPSASYVPCIEQLAEGWTAGQLDAGRGSTRFALLPHRAGARTVDVAFEETCDSRGATPAPPRAEGVRTSVKLASVSPRYAGTIFDVFPGGCVSYRFDFARGPHIGLMEDLGDTVGLFSRRQLRVDLHDQLGVELDG
jgi:hypothetical protein